MTMLEITGKAKEYREIQALLKQLEEEADALKAEMIAELEAQGVDSLNADIFTIKYTAYKSNRLDTTALKNELPDIAARYTKVTEARRFQVA